jgi:ribonuclease D
MINADNTNINRYSSYMKKQYIDTQDALIQFCTQLSNEPWFALDTEFIRETTYYPVLCLIQVGNNDQCACIDPLKLESLEPLLDLIYRPDITKVLHASRQDMEIFFNMRGSLPDNIFDTQIAAPLLGYQDQIGYGKLVEEILGVKLEKGHSRADWSHRPLSEAEIEYASDDVIYLAQLYPKMVDALKSKHRLNWLDDDFKILSSTQLYTNIPEDMWLRIKAANRFNGKQLAIIQQLAKWRELTAVSENRPRNRLMRDDTLLDIARMQPEDINTLARIRGLHERVVKRHGETIVQQIRSAATQKPLAKPDVFIPEKPSADQDVIIELLTAVVHLRAIENELSATQLASKKEIQQLVLGRNSAILTGWRKSMIGDELLKILDGQLSLSINDNKLTISETIKQ